VKAEGEGSLFVRGANARHCCAAISATLSSAPRRSASLSFAITCAWTFSLCCAASLRCAAAASKISYQVLAAARSNRMGIEGNKWRNGSHSAVGIAHRRSSCSRAHICSFITNTLLRAHRGISAVKTSLVSIDETTARPWRDAPLRTAAAT